jgi:hypothetical protein
MLLACESSLLPLTQSSMSFASWAAARISRGSFWMAVRFFFAIGASRMQKPRHGRCRSLSAVLRRRAAVQKGTNLEGHLNMNQNNEKEPAHFCEWLQPWAPHVGHGSINLRSRWESMDGRCHTEAARRQIWQPERARQPQRLSEARFG